MVVGGFTGAITVGTVLLMLPLASAKAEWTDPVSALFTATSAVCVTGLVVVDTGSYWSVFGQVVIVCLFQVGGLGIMTVASLLGMLVARRMGMRMELIAHTETKNLRIGDVRRVVIGVVRLSLLIEIVIAVLIGVRYYVTYTDSAAAAAGFAVFHAVSAFNNAGFALQADSVMQFVGDPFILMPLMLGFTLGALGFPVLFEVGRYFRQQVIAAQKGRGRMQHRQWTLHTKITILAHAALAVVGIVAVMGFEWANPATLGQLTLGEKLLGGVFQGLAPRTVGFNSLEVGDMNSATVLITNVLMFIGGGSAGTAGGIKVTTFALLGYVIFAELRGHPTVHVMGRKLAESVQRQALTVALLGVAAVVSATVAILAVTDHETDVVMFEVISAFGTVGLSMGITDDLPVIAHLILVVLMLLGRVGPIMLASALALQERPRRYELPEERPIVG
ncbi:TrkH family potassium uptake protein [Hoyosella subflava]|uniref:Putative cation transporter n=1 Tax=Hoyosella subflava (strain DSM 45089 / JCM 17490 / NBRC 109087 / DQS3-9A1) TaxID=443218 RepID=F6EL21_HOYSD|nr:potassium transporter TrkG [Hoyosella subflava]AEF42684.1 Putative cation transporter [Hoyosella subflava DQS3-9A1]